LIANFADRFYRCKVKTTKKRRTSAAKSVQNSQDKVNSVE
jgi:hypothetical protein